MFFRMSAGPQRIPEFTHIHAGRLRILRFRSSNELIRLRVYITPNDAPMDVKRLF